MAAAMLPSHLQSSPVFGWLVAAMVSLVALVLPVGYFTLGYGALESAIETKAAI